MLGLLILMNLILSILIEGHIEAREIIYGQETQIPIHSRLWKRLPGTVTKILTPSTSARSPGSRELQPSTPASSRSPLSHSSTGKTLSKKLQRKEDKKKDRSRRGSREDEDEVTVAALKEQLDRMDKMLRKLLDSSGGHLDS